MAGATPNGWSKNDWQTMCRSFEPTGSRVICDPPVVGTDEDYVVFATNDKLSDWLNARGFVQDGSPEFYTGNDNGGFRSYRKGELNLIITQSQEFFDLFCTATALAKRFNLTEKCDRIALFQAILYGVKQENLNQKSEV